MASGPFPGHHFGYLKSCILKSESFQLRNSSKSEAKFHQRTKSGEFRNLSFSMRMIRNQKQKTDLPCEIVPPQSLQPVSVIDLGRECGTAVNFSEKPEIALYLSRCYYQGARSRMQSFQKSRSHHPCSNAVFLLKVSRRSSPNHTLILNCFQWACSCFAQVEDYQQLIRL